MDKMRWRGLGTQWHAKNKRQINLRKGKFTIKGKNKLQN